MTRDQLNLAANMLEMAADQFSNNGCNDFDLNPFFESHEELERFIEEFHIWNGDPSEFKAYSPENLRYALGDSSIMAFLAFKLGELAEGDNETDTA